jgi:hypothetical protein
MTYSQATILFQRILSVSPESKMTLEDLHCNAVYLSDDRPITDDAGWMAYTSTKAPCLLPR